jgi:hypothetical protein
MCVAQRIHHYTNSSDSDSEVLHTALETMRTVATHCNDVLKPIQDRRALIELQHSLDQSRLQEVPTCTLSYVTYDPAQEHLDFL